MTDYKTKQRKRNMIVGSFVIIGIVIFMWMLLRFRDLPLAVSKFNSFEILVYFPEVPGAQKDTPVQYCGYQIGRVMKVAPPRVVDGSHQVGVTIAIDNDYNDIPADCKFVLLKRGLGSSYIEIRDLSDQEPTDFLTDEMVLTGTVSMASDFFPPEVQEAMPSLVDAITSLTQNVDAVIGDAENQANIKKTLQNTEAAVSQLEKTLESVERFSDQGTETVQTLGNKVVLAAEQLEETLSETRQLLFEIKSGQGSAGKLVRDGRLYENLVESSQELKILLEQLNEWAADNEKGLRIKL